ncbi:MAG: sodium:alanine symporter family protein [Ethanoligenens sp.]|uniref:alanine/glycine:cation symporter family protein n=1 Tax=Ethanoligenens sp. TaxID=2099655 RepID=UPI0039E81A51
MPVLENLLAALSSALWGPPLLCALLGTHVFLTFRMRGIQRHIRKAIRFSVTKEAGASGDVSPFAALTTSLAATLGTGNIVGVATAVAAGGPGAIFWMWLSGIFGMATKYTEALLSVKFRVKRGNTMAGGPMYVMENGLHCRPLGCVFAFFTAIAALGVGASVQSNSIATLFHQTFRAPPVLSGFVVALLTGFVILGGIHSISKVCNWLIPAAGALYILSNLFILGIGWRSIPHSIFLILYDAFSGHAAIGGFLGATAKDAVRFGISRGLFSNEAGLGSSPIVDAAAQCKNPVRQALVSSTGVFWDTVVLAALTGIMLVNSGLWQQGLDGGALTSAVFQSVPVVGPAVLAVSLFTFAFATCIGWSYYAEKAVEYLFGAHAIRPYKCLYIAVIFFGGVVSVTAAWNFSDIANALMAIPNLASVLVLSGVAARETRREMRHGGILQR